MHHFSGRWAALSFLAATLLGGARGPGQPQRVVGQQTAPAGGERSAASLSSAQDATSGGADVEADSAAAILQQVRSYVAAFNAGNAAALAKHWSQDGVFIQRTTGERVVGRDAIEAAFREMFAQGPAGQLQVEVESIRMLRPDVAVEDGTARFTPATGPLETTAYTAIYVREDNQWKLDSIRETASPSPPTNYDLLSEWEWMVGDWSDELEPWKVETRCAWAANRNFLSRSFQVLKDDQVQIQGVQVIGYDPTIDRFRCWVFHSGGGFGEGTMELKDGRLALVSGGDTVQGTELGYFPVRRSKQGTWVIDTIGQVRLAEAQPNTEKLRELQWMVGQWVDEDAMATIKTTCSWAPNQAFLRRSFEVSVQDRIDLAGVQVLGWDADSGQFRSWVFDSAGGFASGLWSKEGDRWIVKSAGVLFGGQKASSVQIITPIDNDSFTLEAVDREIGGQLLPDIEKVTVVRQSSSP